MSSARPCSRFARPYGPSDRWPTSWSGIRMRWSTASAVPPKTADDTPSRGPGRSAAPYRRRTGPGWLRGGRGRDPVLCALVDTRGAGRLRAHRRLKRSTIDEPVAGDGYQSLVLGMNRVLGTLAREIAAEIRSRADARASGR